MSKSKGLIELDLIVILIFILLFFGGIFGAYFYRAHQDRNDVTNAVKAQSQTDQKAQQDAVAALQKISDAQLAALKAQGQQQLAVANQKVQAILAQTNQEINAIENIPSTPCLIQAVPDTIIEQFLAVATITAPPSPPPPVTAPVIPAKMTSPPVNKSPPLVSLAINLPHSIMYVPITQGEQP